MQKAARWRLSFQQSTGAS